MAHEIDSAQAKIAALEKKATKEEKAKELAEKLQENRETFFTSADSAQASIAEGVQALKEPQNKAIIESYGADMAGWLTRVATEGEQILKEQLEGKKAKGLEKIAQSGKKINERIEELKQAVQLLKACEYAEYQEKLARKSIDLAKKIREEKKLGEEKLSEKDIREKVTAMADKAIEELAAGKKTLKGVTSDGGDYAEYYNETLKTVNEGLEEAGNLKIFYDVKDFVELPENMAYAPTGTFDPDHPYRRGPMEASPFFLLNETTGEVQTTEEFRNLPEEKQKELIMRLYVLKKKIADDIEEQCAVTEEEKKFCNGKKLMASGEWRFAKKDFLEFVKETEGKDNITPEEETQIKECKEHLKQIATLQLAMARQRLNLMRESLTDQFTGVFSGGELDVGVIPAMAEKNMKDMEGVLDTAERQIEKGEALTIEEVNKNLWDAKAEGGALWNWQHGFYGGETWTSGKKEHHLIFDVLRTQIQLDNETDPKKREQKILALAKEAHEKGLFALARSYYDQYFEKEIHQNAKKIARADIVGKMQQDGSVQSQITEQLNSMKPQIIEEFKKKHDREPTEAEMNDILSPERSKMFSAMVDTAYMKAVKTSVHRGFKEYEDLYSHTRKVNFRGPNVTKGPLGGPEGARADIWNSVYGNDFVNLESLDTSWYQFWKFDEVEWNQFKVMVWVDIAMIIGSAGVGSVAAEGLVGRQIAKQLLKKGLTHGAVEQAMKKGGAHLARLVVKELGYKEAIALGLGHFIVESGTFHTLHGKLNEFIRGAPDILTDPATFFKTWGQSALQLGSVKVAALGYSFKRAAESAFGKIVDHLGRFSGEMGLQTLTGLALMAASGEEITEEKIARMNRDNIVFEIGIRGAHAVTGRGAAEEAATTGKKSKFMSGLEGKVDAEEAFAVQKAETARRELLKKGKKIIQEIGANEEIVNVKIKDLESLKRRRLVPEDYDYFSDPEILSAKNETELLERMQTRISKSREKYIMDNLDQDIHDEVVGLAKYVKKGITEKVYDATHISNAPIDQYTIIKTHVDESTLPADWKNKLRGENPEFYPGKCFVIEYELQSSKKKSYRIISATRMNKNYHVFNLLFRSTDDLGTTGYFDLMERINKAVEDLPDPLEAWKKEKFRSAGAEGFTFRDQMDGFEPDEISQILNLASQLHELGGEDLRLHVLKKTGEGEPLFSFKDMQAHLREKIDERKKLNERNDRSDMFNGDDPEVHWKMMIMGETLKLGAAEKEQVLKISKDKGKSQEEWIVDDVYLKKEDLPAEWEKGTHGQSEIFEEGKNFVMRLRSKGDAKIEYRVIAAAAVARDSGLQFGLKMLLARNGAMYLAEEVAFGYIHNVHPVTDEGRPDYLQRAQDAKREIYDRSDISMKEKAKLLKEKIAEIRKEISAREKLISETIKSGIHQIGEILKNNPYAPSEKVMRLLKEKSDIAGKFTEFEIKEIEAALKEAFDKSKIIKRYSDAYSDRPELLFEIQFGFKPEGKVTLITTDFSLAFQVDNLSDYAKAGKYGSVERAARAGGCSLPSSPIADLRGQVTLVRSDVGKYLNDVLIHEERHNINRFIAEKTGEKGYEPTVLWAASWEKKRIENYFSDLLKLSLNRAKDEIIAYMKDGSSAEEIASTLTQKDGLYDYWANDYFPLVNNKILSSDSANLSGEDRNLVLQFKTKYRELHNKVVRQAVQNAFKTGDVDLLAVTPVRQWGKIETAIEAEAKQINNSFTEIYKPGYTTLGHGTLLEAAKSIFESGLEAKVPHLGTTTIPVIDSKKSASEQNHKIFREAWAHKNFKCIIIIQIPNPPKKSKIGGNLYFDSVFEELPSDKRKGTGRPYVIPTRFIQGYVNMDTKEFIPNPHFDPPAELKINRHMKVVRMGAGQENAKPSPIPSGSSSSDDVW